MTSPTCPAAAFGCSCRKCVRPEPDLTALKNMNRATYTTAMLLIFLAIFLSALAAGFIHADRVQELVAAERRV